MQTMTETEHRLTNCIAEHDLGDRDCAREPVAIPVMRPTPDEERVVLLGPHSGRYGRYVEIDVNGTFTRVRLDELHAAVTRLFVDVGPPEPTT